jgi:hypothetical protein
VLALPLIIFKKMFHFHSFPVLLSYGFHTARTLSGSSEVCEPEGGKEHSCIMNRVKPPLSYRYRPVMFKNGFDSYTAEQSVADALPDRAILIASIEQPQKNRRRETKGIPTIPWRSKASNTLVINIL